MPSCPRFALLRCLLIAYLYNDSPEQGAKNRLYYSFTTGHFFKRLTRGIL